MTRQKAFLKRVQQTVQQNVSAKVWSIGVYYGGNTVSFWKSIPSKQQPEALRKSKDWYIWYKYRNPDTGKLQRFANLKLGINRLRTVNERLSFINSYTKAMQETFKEGHNPFNEIPREEGQRKKVKEALQHALEIRSLTIGQSTIRDYTSTVNSFLKYLKSQGQIHLDITLVSRKIVTKYLNYVLSSTSARKRNNEKKPSEVSAAL